MYTSPPSPSLPVTSPFLLPTHTSEWIVDVPVHQGAMLPQDEIHCTMG